MLEQRQFDFSQKVLHHDQHIKDYLNLKRPFPVNIEIDLTNACNHNCSFCCYANYLSTTRASLSTEVVKRALNQLKELGALSINWTGGGEPLLHRDFLEILAYSNSIGLQNGLITNFAKARPKYHQRMLANLSWIRVSMAGGDPSSYKEVQGVDDFELVWSNITTILAERSRCNSSTDFGIACIINKANVTSLHSLLERSSDAGVDYVQIRKDMYSNEGDIRWWDSVVPRIIEEYLSSSGSSLKVLGEQYSELYSQTDYPSACHAHSFVMGINAEGYVAFCKNTRSNPDFYYGNINDSPLSDIWNHNQRLTELEGNLCPSNCGTYCKNMGINLSVEDVKQGKIPLDDLCLPDFPTVNFL